MKTILFLTFVNIVYASVHTFIESVVPNGEYLYYRYDNTGRIFFFGGTSINDILLNQINFDASLYNTNSTLELYLDTYIGGYCYYELSLPIHLSQDGIIRICAGYVTLITLQINEPMQEKILDTEIISFNSVLCADHFVMLSYNSNGSVLLGGTQPDGSVHYTRNDCFNVKQGLNVVYQLPIEKKRHVGLRAILSFTSNATGTPNSPNIFYKTYDTNDFSVILKRGAYWHDGPITTIVTTTIKIDYYLSNASTSLSVSPSNTISVSPSNTISVSPSNTISVSPSNTISVSPSNTINVSPSNTISVSPSIGPIISSIVDKENYISISIIKQYLTYVGYGLAPLSLICFIGCLYWKKKLCFRKKQQNNVAVNVNKNESENVTAADIPQIYNHNFSVWIPQPPAPHNFSVWIPQPPAPLESSAPSVFTI